MATSTRPQPTWQSHKYAESTDSEVSYFDTSTSTTTDSWAGYFEGWEQQQPQQRSQDDYCPRVVRSSESPTPIRMGHSSTPKMYDHEELLPAACPRRRHRSEGNADPRHDRRNRRTINTKRFGMAPFDNPDASEGAIAHMNASLKNSMSNTEDILSAMYSPDWDAASLQKWYQQSSKTPADLALFKIMFSLRYTPEELVPSS